MRNGWKGDGENTHGVDEDVVGVVEMLVVMVVEVN